MDKHKLRRVIITFVQCIAFLLYLYIGWTEISASSVIDWVLTFVIIGLLVSCISIVIAIFTHMVLHLIEDPKYLDKYGYRKTPEPIENSAEIDLCIPVGFGGVFIVNLILLLKSIL